MICHLFGLGRLPVVRVVVPEPFHSGGMRIFLVDVVAIVCKCEEEEALKKLEAVTGNEDPAMKYRTMKHQDRWLCGDGTACKHFIMKLPFTSQQAAGKHCESARPLLATKASYLSRCCSWCRQGWPVHLGLQATFCRLPDAGLRVGNQFSNRSHVWHRCTSWARDLEEAVRCNNPLETVTVLKRGQYPNALVLNVDGRFESPLLVDLKTNSAAAVQVLLQEMFLKWMKSSYRNTSHKLHPKLPTQKFPPKTFPSTKDLTKHLNDLTRPKFTQMKEKHLKNRHEDFEDNLSWAFKNPITVEK